MILSWPTLRSGSKSRGFLRTTRLHIVEAIRGRQVTIRKEQGISGNVIVEDKEMGEKNYRLGEFQITESDTGELRWKAHFGLGALQEGTCFTKGTILFIGPSRSDRSGFLKGEFLDHLRQFPEWFKTKYYCRSPEIYHCMTGKRVTKAEIQIWRLERSLDEYGRILAKKPGTYADDRYGRSETGEVAFRLQRYEVIKQGSDRAYWRTFAGPDTVSTGGCVILEDILFVCPRRTGQFHLAKRQFLSNLKKLRRWDQTRYFCLRVSLYDCRTGMWIQEA